MPNVNVYGKFSTLILMSKIDGFGLRNFKTVKCYQFIMKVRSFIATVSEKLSWKVSHIIIPSRTAKLFEQIQRKCMTTESLNIIHFYCRISHTMRRKIKRHGRTVSGIISVKTKASWKFRGKVVAQEKVHRGYHNIVLSAIAYQYTLRYNEIVAHHPQSSTRVT